jgi:hypothetical protein
MNHFHKNITHPLIHLNNTGWKVSNNMIVSLINETSEQMVTKDHNL